MANTYKNIVITPNRDTDAANVPVIRFSGGDATTNTDINVRVYTTQSGTLSFEGSAGQLFSITNDLTNSIFSVNDVSGIPSIDVYANGNILLAPFGGQIFIGNTVNLNFDSTASTKIVDPAANTLAFHTAQTERMRIDSSGNVGIGTSSLTNRLQVFTSNANTTDSVYITGGGGLTRFIRISPALGLGSFNPIVSAGDSGIIYGTESFQSNGAFVIAPWTTTASGIKFDFSGNVLIGRTTSTVGSGVKLDVAGAANASNLLVNGNMVFTAANDGSGSNLDADLLDGQQGSYYLANTAGISTAGAFIVPGVLTANAGGNGLLMRAGGTADHVYISYYPRSNTGSRGAYVGYGGAATNNFSIINETTTGTLELGTTGGADITIDAAGEVGIGRLDPGYKLDVVGTANASNILVNGNMVFTAANDGAGSNLDADLLDGQQGTYYGIATDVTAANRVANAAFLHANASYAFGNSAHSIANLAFTHANNAYSTANNATTLGKAIAMVIVFG